MTQVVEELIDNLPEVIEQPTQQEQIFTDN